MTRSLLSALVLTALIGVSGVAHGQKKGDDFIPDAVLLAKKKKAKGKKKKKEKQGWIPALKVGFTFGFAQSQGVVGIPDGTTISVGLNLDGELIFRRGAHSWVSHLKVLHTQTKLHNIEPFIKAADQFDLASEYRYRFPKLRWFSLFGGVRLTSPLLPGDMVHDKDRDLLLQLSDGTTRVETALGQTKFRLTNAFAPLLFKQFLGVAFLPLEKKKLKVEVKVGTGAVEVWGQGGLVPADDKATPIFELKQLRDYAQGGVEVQVDASGQLFKKILGYGLRLEVMYPFGTSIATTLSGAELFNVELSAKINIKVFKWLAINYALSVLRVPLVQPDWQIVNNLMLALTVDILK